LRRFPIAIGGSVPICRLIALHLQADVRIMVAAGFTNNVSIKKLAYYV
jgi:hypothetical protein